MKTQMRQITLLGSALLALSACQPSSKGNPNSRFLIDKPGYTFDGRKVDALPASQKTVVIDRLTKFASVRDVLQTSMGVSQDLGNSQSGSGTPRSPSTDLERQIKGDVATRCAVVAIDQSKARPDANGKTDFTADGKINGSGCPVDAKSHFHTDSQTTGSSDNSETKANFSISSSVTVLDPGYASNLDGLISADLSITASMQSKTAMTSRDQATWSVALMGAANGHVKTQHDDIKIEMASLSTQKMSVNAGKFETSAAGKTTSVLESKELGTIVIDTIISTEPNKQPISKYYLNGEEIDAQIGERLK